jgi:hypothetical protein
MWEGHPMKGRREYFAASGVLLSKKNRAEMRRERKKRKVPALSNALFN